MKKTFLKAILIIFFVSNFMNAQSQDVIIKKLIDSKLIEKNEVKDFKEIQNQIDAKGKAAYLYGLFQCEYKNLTGHFYTTFSGDMITAPDPKLSEKEQKKENGKLTDYLTALKKCELLNEKQFQYFLEEIKTNSYGFKLQFLKEISFMALKADYMSSERLKKYANFLKENKIVDTKYQNLLSAIDNEKIIEPIEFLAYCEKSIIIDAKNYSNKPEEYLEAIHKQTASLMPELSFTDFDFKITLDDEMSSYGDNFYKCVVTFKSNGKIYKQKSGFYPSTKNDYSTGKINIDTYYQIFNKVLIDLNSPYLLHNVQIYNDNNTENKVFGIIALTKEQGQILYEQISYVTPSYEEYKKAPTSENIEQAIESFTKIGLLSSLTANEINQGKEKVAEQINGDYSSVLSAFPNIIYWFDTELGNLENPYAELVSEFSKISHNEFKPTDIVNDFDIEKSNQSKLDFKIGNKSYSKVLKINNDWIDESFFDFMNSVATENKLKGQFYNLHTGGQDALVIYLTKEQYKYIKENKLLDFWDESLLKENE